MSAAARISADDFANQAAAHFATTPGKLFIPASYNTNRGDPIYRDEQDAFPAVKVPYRPLGSTVFVQLRLPPLELTGMFEVNDEDRRTERDNQQVGKVVAVGPLAFKRRDTGELWPEGSWCKVGDFVYVPKYQGDRCRVKHKRVLTKVSESGRETKEIVVDDLEFALFKDLAILGAFESYDEAVACRGFL